MEKFLGLPLHPLVVHAVVVLVPLAALGGIAISVLKKARARYGWLVAAGALAAAVSTLVAQQAGKSLKASLGFTNPAIERHAELGVTLLVWTILLFAGTTVVMLGDRLIGQRDRRGNLVLLAGIIVTVVSAVVSLIQTVRIGHSGSVAVWGGG